MAALPTGTVILLFADIEGSTRLGDAMSRCSRSLGGCWGLPSPRFDGREVATEGGAFFVALAKASRVVVAAVAGRQALSTRRCPDGVAVWVRMGIHTGEPIVVGQDYAGLEVHRAARIYSAAHGG